jgi:branched-chain amino acid transport system permease protein
VAVRSGYYKTRYSLDTGFFETPFRRFWCLVGLVVLLALPWLVSSFWLGLANLALIAVVGAVALHLLTGVAGQLSLGHAGFLAAGAFSTAILVRQFGAPFWVTLPAALLLGALLGLAVGVPALRLKGVYLAVSTLAAHFVILSLGSEYQSHASAGAGFPIPAPTVGGWRVRGEVTWYYVLLGPAAAAVALALNVRRNHIGRAWQLMREGDLVAASVGIDVAAYKVLAFVVTTAMTTFEGALWAYYTGFVATEAFGFLVTVQYLAMILIGGLGALLGSILGAVFITILPFAVERGVHALPVPPAFQSLLFAVEGAVFALLMLFFLLIEPTGLAGLWRRVRGYFELWPFKHLPVQR